METEKITINLGAVDLGQIDLLVDQGFYSNRTDLIRTAIRNQLALHAKDINGIKAFSSFGLDVEGDQIVEGVNKIKQAENAFSTANLLAQGFTGTGLFAVSLKDLEEVRASGKRINIKMVGMLIIDKKASPELVEQTFGTVKVYGIIKATDEIKRVLERKKG